MASPKGLSQEEAGVILKIPAGKASPDGYNQFRATQGHGDYHGWPADSDLGRAFAYFRDGMDSTTLHETLQNVEFMYEDYLKPGGQYFDNYNTEAERREAYEENHFDIAITLIHNLKAVLYEMKEEWVKPPLSAEELAQLPQVKDEWTSDKNNYGASEY
jgi:hypothetical protein